MCEEGFGKAIARSGGYPERGLTWSRESPLRTRPSSSPMKTCFPFYFQYVLMRRDLPPLEPTCIYEIKRSTSLLCFCVPRVCPPFRHGPVYLLQRNPPPRGKRYPQIMSSSACKFAEGTLRRQIPTLPSDVNPIILPESGQQLNRSDHLRSARGCVCASYFSRISAFIHPVSPPERKEQSTSYPPPQSLHISGSDPPAVSAFELDSWRDDFRDAV
jgi:hypothetical protein